MVDTEKLPPSVAEKIEEQEQVDEDQGRETSVVVVRDQYGNYKTSKGTTRTISDIRQELAKEGAVDVTGIEGNVVERAKEVERRNIQEIKNELNQLWKASVTKRGSEQISNELFRRQTDDTRRSLLLQSISDTTVPSSVLPVVSPLSKEEAVKRQHESIGEANKPLFDKLNVDLKEWQKKNKESNREGKLWEPYWRTAKIINAFVADKIDQVVLYNKWSPESKQLKNHEITKRKIEALIRQNDATAQASSKMLGLAESGNPHAITAIEHNNQAIEYTNKQIKDIAVNFYDEQLKYAGSEEEAIILRNEKNKLLGLPQAPLEPPKIAKQQVPGLFHPDNREFWKSIGNKIDYHFKMPKEAKEEYDKKSDIVKAGMIVTGAGVGLYNMFKQPLFWNAHSGMAYFGGTVAETKGGALVDLTRHFYQKPVQASLELYGIYRIHNNGNINRKQAAALVDEQGMVWQGKTIYGPGPKDLGKRGQIIFDEASLKELGKVGRLKDGTGSHIELADGTVYKTYQKSYEGSPFTVIKKLDPRTQEITTTILRDRKSGVPKEVLKYKTKVIPEDAVPVIDGYAVAKTKDFKSLTPERMIELVPYYKFEPTSALSTRVRKIPPAKATDIKVPMVKKAPTLELTQEGIRAKKALSGKLKEEAKRLHKQRQELQLYAAFGKDATSTTYRALTTDMHGRPLRPYKETTEAITYIDWRNYHKLDKVKLFEKESDILRTQDFQKFTPLDRLMDFFSKYKTAGYYRASKDTIRVRHSYPYGTHIHEAFHRFIEKSKSRKHMPTREQIFNDFVDVEYRLNWKDKKGMDEGTKREMAHHTIQKIEQKVHDFKYPSSQKLEEFLVRLSTKYPREVFKPTTPSGHFMHNILPIKKITRIKPEEVIETVRVKEKSKFPEIREGHESPFRALDSVERDIGTMTQKRVKHAEIKKTLKHKINEVWEYTQNTPAEQTLFKSNLQKLSDNAKKKILEAKQTDKYFVSKEIFDKFFPDAVKVRKPGSKKKYFTPKSYAEYIDRITKRMTKEQRKELDATYNAIQKKRDKALKEILEKDPDLKFSYEAGTLTRPQRTMLEKDIDNRVYGIDDSPVKTKLKEKQKLHKDYATIGFGKAKVPKSKPPTVIPRSKSVPKVRGKPAVNIKAKNTARILHRNKLLNNLKNNLRVQNRLKSELKSEIKSNIKIKIRSKLKAKQKIALQIAQKLKLKELTDIPPVPFITKIPPPKAAIFPPIGGQIKKLPGQSYQPLIRTYVPGKGPRNYYMEESGKTLKDAINLGKEEVDAQPATSFVVVGSKRPGIRYPATSAYNKFTLRHGRFYELNKYRFDRNAEKKYGNFGKFYSQLKSKR